LKYLVDEDISPKTSNFLSNLGYDIKHLREVNLKGSRDEEVMRFAKSENRILITMDADFANISIYPLGTHPGIIRIRLRYPTVHKVNQILKGLLSRAEDLKIEGCLVVATSRVFRIKRPG
jgi:predicted nuclease of predicted toxin-antitoxin system